jgi:hypothetical protein
MWLPEELQMIINEYAKPLTKPDYKKGSYFIRNLVKNNDVISYTIVKMYILLCSADLTNISDYVYVLNHPDTIE